MASPPAPANVTRHAARLSSRIEGHPLVPVTLELPREVLASHTVPGQYVSILAGGENGYFVIASSVGADAWRLLVKGGGTVADALLSAPLGTVIPTSGALGDGFPTDEARGRALIVAAAGTGIAAALPIVAQRIADGDAGRTHVLMGLRQAADLPCADDVEAWRAAGIDVVLCLSRPAPHDPIGPAVARGYVQDVARARLARGEGAMLFAVGPAPMVDGIRAIAALLGVAAEDVRTNY